MRTIAIAARKGGVGKTTSAVHLAAGLAAEGNQVLLVDCDAQGHCALCLGVSPETGLGHVIRGEATLKDAVLEARPGVWLLAGGSSLANINDWLAAQPAGADLALTRALQGADVDFVILDCPPGFSRISVNAVIYADEILVPVSMEALSVAGLVDLEAELQGLRDLGVAIAKPRILPTFLDGRVGKTGEILEQLRGRYADLLPAIRYSVKFSEAPAWGETVYERDPGGRGAEDYRQLCVEVA